MSPRRRATWRIPAWDHPAAVAAMRHLLAVGWRRPELQTPPGAWGLSEADLHAARRLYRRRHRGLLDPAGDVEVYVAAGGGLPTITLTHPTGGLTAPYAQIEVASVQRGIDHLVAEGVLPARLSTAHAAGWLEAIQQADDRPRHAEPEPDGLARGALVDLTIQRATVLGVSHNRHDDALTLPGGITVGLPGADVTVHPAGTLTNPCDACGSVTSNRATGDVRLCELCTPAELEPIPARQLSCQGLTMVDLDASGGPRHYGRPVTGYAEEMARRGEGHVHGCELIGHAGGKESVAAPAETDPYAETHGEPEHNYTYEAREGDLLLSASDEATWHPITDMVRCVDDACDVAHADSACVVVTSTAYATGAAHMCADSLLNVRPVLVAGHPRPPRLDIWLTLAVPADPRGAGA